MLRLMAEVWVETGPCWPLWLFLGEVILMKKTMQTSGNQSICSWLSNNKSGWPCHWNSSKKWAQVGLHIYQSISGPC